MIRALNAVARILYNDHCTRQRSKKLRKRWQRILVIDSKFNGDWCHQYTKDIPRSSKCVNKTLDTESEVPFTWLIALRQWQSGVTISGKRTADSMAWSASTTTTEQHLIVDTALWVIPRGTHACEWSEGQLLSHINHRRIQKIPTHPLDRSYTHHQSHHQWTYVSSTWLRDEMMVYLFFIITFSIVVLYVYCVYCRYGSLLKDIHCVTNKG